MVKVNHRRRKIFVAIFRQSSTQNNHQGYHQWVVVCWPVTCYNVMLYDVMLYDVISCDVLRLDVTWCNVLLLVILRFPFSWAVRHPITWLGAPILRYSEHFTETRAYKFLKINIATKQKSDTKCSGWTILFYSKQTAIAAIANKKIGARKEQ